MPTIPKTLQQMARNLDKLATQLANRGIKPIEATAIGIAATAICESAATIAGATRESQGRKGAKQRLRRKVRAALGFLYP